MLTMKHSYVRIQVGSSSIILNERWKVVGVISTKDGQFMNVGAKSEMQRNFNIGDYLGNVYKMSVGINSKVIWVCMAVLLKTF